MNRIGARIRSERQALGLSLKELAQKVGISPMTLQRIETDKTSPSVSVLADISHHLTRPIDFFLKDKEPKLVIVRKGQQSTIESLKMKLTIIAPPGLVDDSIVVNLGEAQEGKFIDSHMEDGYSLVHMLEGGCVFEHDGVEHTLEAGDTLYYNARYKHSVRTNGGKHRFLSIFFKGRN